MEWRSSGGRPASRGAPGYGSRVDARSSGHTSPTAATGEHTATAEVAQVSKIDPNTEKRCVWAGDFCGTAHPATSRRRRRTPGRRGSPPRPPPTD